MAITGYKGQGFGAIIPCLLWWLADRRSFFSILLLRWRVWFYHAVLLEPSGKNTKLHKFLPLPWRGDMIIKVTLLIPPPPPITRGRRLNEWGSMSGLLCSGINVNSIHGSPPITSVHLFGQGLVQNQTWEIRNIMMGRLPLHTFNDRKRL